MRNRAVFLDRDGVINALVCDAEHGIIDSPFNPDQFKLLPGVGKAIRLIKETGFLAVVVSNQPCVAKGKSNLELLRAIDEKMERELAEREASLDGVYHCLHHPDPAQVRVKKYLKNCSCRKPKPGLLLEAAKELGIDLSESWMIGDGLIDIQAGKSAGCKTILLAKFKCDLCQEMKKRRINPDLIVSDLLSAVKRIGELEERKS